MVGGNFLQGRQLTAAVAGIIATLVEAALVARLDGGADLALDQDALLLGAQFGDGDGRQQSLGVRMHGIGEQFLGGSLFHDLTQIHNGDLIGEVVKEITITYINWKAPDDGSISSGALFLDIIFT